VLNLTYIGKKNADSIDKMTDGVNKMAATNQRNTEIIAALVGAILPNSTLAHQVAESLSDPHKGEGVPIEEFLKGAVGIDPLSKPQPGGKKTVKNK
jgi:hypothetical protein